MPETPKPPDRMRSKEIPGVLLHDRVQVLAQSSAPTKQLTQATAYSNSSLFIEAVTNERWRRSLLFVSEDYAREESVLTIGPEGLVKCYNPRNTTLEKFLDDLAEDVLPGPLYGEDVSDFPSDYLEYLNREATDKMLEFHDFQHIIRMWHMRYLNGVGPHKEILDTPAILKRLNDVMKIDPVKDRLTR